MKKKIKIKKGFKKRKPEGKISQVVSEALIGEEKNFGRFFFFFLISLQFLWFSFSVRKHYNVFHFTFAKFIWCLVNMYNHERNGK